MVATKKRGFKWGKMGVLYALATPSMRGIIRIVATDDDDDPLTDANAPDPWRPPEPYALVCRIDVDDAPERRSAVFSVMRSRRVAPSLDFFYASAEEVSTVFGLLSAHTSPTAAVSAPRPPTRRSSCPALIDITALARPLARSTAKPRRNLTSPPSFGRGPRVWRGAGGYAEKVSAVAQDARSASVAAHEAR